MASTIQLKTGTGSAVPSSLTQGEVGINIDNGLIFYGSGSGNVVKKLESFTNITASSNISASGTLTSLSGSFGEVSASGFIHGEGYIIQGKSLAHIVGPSELLAFGYQDNIPIRIGRTANPTRIAGNISASGNITATGSIHTLGDITASGDIKGSTLTGTVSPLVPITCKA